MQGSRRLGELVTLRVKALEGETLEEKTLEWERFRGECFIGRTLDEGNLRGENLEAGTVRTLIHSLRE